MPEPSSSSAPKTTSSSTTQDSSLDGNWFEAIEILDQKGSKYLVSWAGIDPDTGKQWKPTWVSVFTNVLTTSNVKVIVRLRF